MPLPVTSIIDHHGSSDSPIQTDQKLSNMSNEGQVNTHHSSTQKYTNHQKPSKRPCNDQLHLQSLSHPLLPPTSLPVSVTQLSPSDQDNSAELRDSFVPSD